MVVKCNKAHLFLFFRALALGTRDALVEFLRGGVGGWVRLCFDGFHLSSILQFLEMLTNDINYFKMCIFASAVLHLFDSVTAHSLCRVQPHVLQTLLPYGIMHAELRFYGFDVMGSSRLFS